MSRNPNTYPTPFLPSVRADLMSVDGNVGGFVQCCGRSIDEWRGPVFVLQLASPQSLPLQNARANPN